MGAQPFWSTTDKDAGSTVSNGNRTATQAAMNAGATRSARGVTSGKWYVEVDITTSTDAGLRAGIMTSAAAIGSPPGGDALGWGIRGSDGNKITNGNNFAYGNSLDSPLRIALDADAGKVWFGEGTSTWWGDPAAGTGEAFSGLSGILHLAFGANNSANTKIGTLRLLANYVGSPPAGFTAGFGLDADVTADKAMVSLSGQPAAASGGAAVAPVRANLAVAGVAAAVRGDAVALPAAAYLSVAGRAAAVVAGAVVAAGRAVAAIAGRAATVIGGTGAIVDAGRATVVVAGRPATAIGTGAGVVAAGAGLIQLRGLAAAVAAAAVVAAAPATLAARGTAALAVADAVVSAGPAAMRIAGRPAAVVGGTGAVVSPAAAALVSAGRGVDLVLGVAPAVGPALLSTGGRPAIAVADGVVTAAPAALALAGRPAATVAGTGAIVAPAVASLSVGGRAGAVVADAAASAGAGTLAASGRSAAAVGGTGAGVVAGRTTLAAAGRPATIRGDGVVLPAPVPSALAGRSVVVRGDAVVSPGRGAASVQGRPATALGTTSALAVAGAATVAVAGRPATAIATHQVHAVATAGGATSRIRGLPTIAVGSAPLLPPVPTPGDLAALFADPQAELEWVAIVEPWDAEAEAIVPLRLSARGMVTDPDADLPDTVLPARLRDFHFLRRLWAGEIFGPSSAGEGVLAADAAPKAGADDGLAYLATGLTTAGGRRWHFRRRAARVLLGHPRWSWDDLQPVWTGTVADMTLDGDTALFQLRDPTARLDRALQERAFAGDRVVLVSASSVAVDVGALAFVVPDLVTNGTFASSLTGWSAGTGWTQSSGTAAKAAGTAAAIVQDVTTARAREFTIRVGVVRSAGTLQVTADGSPVGDPIAASGTWSRTFRARGSTTRIGFAADAAFAGSIDDVHCRQEPRAAAGDPVRIARTSALSATWMAGEVVSWTEATGTLAVAVSQAVGTGTHSDWSIWLRPYAGTAEVAGQPLPVALGLVRHAPPVDLGSVQGLWLYLLADAPVRCDAALGHGVFTGGEPLDLVGQFPPAAGEAFVDGQIGGLWLASRPSLPLTATFEGLAEAASNAARETAAVDFDGTDDWYERSDPFDGAPTGQIGSAIIEFRVDGGNGTGRGLMQIPGLATLAGVTVFLDAQNELVFLFGTGTYDPSTGYTPAGSWRCESTATFASSSLWRRVAASWDLSVPQFTLKVDGAADTIKGTPTGTLRDIVPRGPFPRVGGAELVFPTVAPFNGCIARCWVALGQKLDLDDPAVMARITTADGYPADLGGAGQRLTGTPPTYFGRGADLGANLGTGGDLAPHSTPGAASSVPWAPAYAGAPGAAPATAADLVLALARRLGFADGEIDLAAFAAFASAAPQRQHVWEVDSGTPGRQPIDRLLAGVGGWIDATPAGLLTVGRWAGPAAVADHELGEADMDAVRREPLPPAAWRRRLGAEHAPRVLREDEIAEDADPDEQQYLSAEWREGVAEDAAVRTADLGAEEVFVATGLVDRDQAAAEAARQLALTGPTLLAVSADCGPRPIAWRMGETVAVTAPSVGIDAPRRMVILAREPRLEADGVTLTLVG